LQALTQPDFIKRGSAEVQERRLLIGRIAASILFQKAPRLRDFLLYAADCTLDNRLADARESVIAERVFNRRLELQGGQDSIVRAEARNLRKRLETYFETEGRNESLIVTIPKGGYVLTFEPRLPQPEAEDPASATTASAAISETNKKQGLPAAWAVHFPQKPIDDRARQILYYRNACIALILLVIGTSALAWHWRSAESRIAEEIHVEQPLFPFSALVGQGREMVIITSDTGLLQISSLAHRRITLDEYMARSYPEVSKIQPPYLIRNWNVWEFTDGREMTIAGLIIRRNAQFAQHIVLRSGHEVQIQDFKDKSNVLIGSPISNPWAQLYEDRLNFRCDLDENGRILFLEKSTSGAITQYPNDDDNRHNRTYARIAFLPATSDVAPSLLIAGTTAQSTEAAGELLLDKSRFGQTLRSMGIDPGGPPRFFEILIRSSDFVGGAILPEVVAWRQADRSGGHSKGNGLDRSTLQNPH
jgi:hypothetical protein